MTKINILFLSFLLSFASHAGEGSSLTNKVKQLENHSKALKNSMHKEVVEAMSENDREIMAEKIDNQITEIKRVHQQVRDQFNNLDANTQRQILLRSAE